MKRRQGLDLRRDVVTPLVRHNVTNAVTPEREPHYCPGGQPLPGPAAVAPAPPLDTIGLDLHKRESQLCLLAADGTVTERRLATTRAAFTAALGGRAPARVLLEASTESEWVARHLEMLGHTVIVADPNYAPMYATRSRREKTDKRDARTLAEATRLGAYRPAHRLSEPQRHVRAELAVRDALVRTRTRFIAVLKSLVRRDGLRLTTVTSASIGRQRSGGNVRLSHTPLPSVFLSAMPIAPRRRGTHLGRTTCRQHQGVQSQRATRSP